MSLQNDNLQIEIRSLEKNVDQNDMLNKRRAQQFLCIHLVCHDHGVLLIA